MEWMANKVIHSVDSWSFMLLSAMHFPPTEKKTIKDNEDDDGGGGTATNQPTHDKYKKWESREKRQCIKRK